jgi:hypothetical protein
MADTEILKKVAYDAIDKAAHEIYEVSQEIWRLQNCNNHRI